ncbi:hypothetical protein OVS_02175 [Mycoplasma ovis str. Michigan]|uniref:Uncharacterized protein n=1 Tax=Mycoplasma ovis str. Michigan TaxID=1415773 RepID=A0ABM5P1L8_9MOLU|nr:hypothetical protein [Mycoplasma ovis]AHC40296.1 hypothetical protein OVS_02175 [Mycoplasma ovis str. Michigan]
MLGGASGVAIPLWISNSDFLNSSDISDNLGQSSPTNFSNRTTITRDNSTVQLESHLTDKNSVELGFDSSTSLQKVELDLS